MVWLSGLCAAIAVLLWWPPQTVRRLRTPVPERSGRRRLPLPVGLAAAVGFGSVAGLTVAGAKGAVLALVAGTGIAVTVWTLHRARARTHREAARDQVARGCDELAALMRAGHSPWRAVTLVSASVPVFAEPAAHHRVGGDLTTALRDASRRPGCSGLARLAATWAIAERTGAAMTTSLDDLAGSLHAERELRRRVDTELAAARLSGRLLGLLPLVGLVLGYAVGGDPVHYLTESPPGLACLGLGVGLGAAGVVWSEQLAERAGRSA